MTDNCMNYAIALTRKARVAEIYKLEDDEISRGRKKNHRY